MDISLILGAFAGMLLGFYGIAKAMLSQAAKDREADRGERNQLSHAIQDMAGASGRVADATDKTAKEAKQRNGHLAELVAQGNSTSQDILKRLDKSAVILSAEKNDGGLLIKTNDDPLLVKNKEV